MDDLAEAGYGTDTRSLVARRAAQARQAGMGGIVCSAEEAAEVRCHRRSRHGRGHARHQAGRQRGGRPEAVMTPGAAIAAGASHLVVARPVIKAPDPAEALARILAAT